MAQNLKIKCSEHYIYLIFFLNFILTGSEVVKIMKCIKWLNQILNECHLTFVSCYHAFYPTPHLKLYSLWELLMDKKNVRCFNITAVYNMHCFNFVIILLD